jgi:hypothetical protein
MDKVKELLSLDDVEIAEEKILQAIERRNLIPDNISDDQAFEIVEELKSGQLTLAPNASPSSNDSKNKKLSSLSEAIAYASRLSAKEINDLKASVDQGRSKWIASQTREIIGSIRNAPKEVISMVSAELLEEEADLETFQQFASQINQAFFAVGE